MVWFKVDDKLHSHAKALQCSDAALGVWVRLGSWCAEQLNGGRVSAQALRHFRVKKSLAAELVRVGLWVSVGDEYQFHDWDDHQPSKDQVLARRKATKERVTRHRNAVTETLSDAGCNAVTDPACNGVSNAYPDPTRPDLNQRSIPSVTADAFERQSGGGESSVRSSGSPAARGRLWLASVLGRDDYDHRGKWEHAFAELAQKPESERRAVAAQLRKELSKPDVRQKLKPQHVLDYWATYVDGRSPGQSQSSARRGIGPVGTPEEYAADAAGGIAPWEK